MRPSTITVSNKIFNLVFGDSTNAIYIPLTREHFHEYTVSFDILTISPCIYIWKLDIDT